MISSMRVPYLLLTVLIGPIATDVHGATIGTPQVSVGLIQSDLTPDRTFISGSPGSSYSRVNTENDRGGVTSVIAGRHESSGSRYAESSPGNGGTLTWNSSSSLNATWNWGQATSQSSWSLNSTVQFKSTLDYQATSTTTGRFFFILNPTNANVFSLERQVRIEVDRPLSIQLSISAAFSTPTLARIDGSSMLMGGPPDFTTGLFYSSFMSDLIGEDGKTLTRPFFTYSNILFGVSERGTADGVVYDILASPVAEGLSETLELRWFANYGSNLSKTGANRLSVDLEEFGTLSESLTVISIPEPSSGLATLIGLGFVAHRRRKTACARKSEVPD